MVFTAMDGMTFRFMEYFENCPMVGVRGIQLPVKHDAHALRRLEADHRGSTDDVPLNTSLFQNRR